MSHVTCEITDGVAEVRLNRPDKLNALTLPILQDLATTAHTLRKDKNLRAVVIAGEGDAFCAGLDFASVMKSPAGIAKAFVPLPWRGTNLFQEACWAWRRLPVPVIAAVHGHCLGGGLQIALAADFRIATPDSRWSVLEGKWGLIPDMSGIRSLSELIGIDQAKLLTMTAEVFDGSRAKELGLVTKLDNDPLAGAHAWPPSCRPSRQTHWPPQSGCSTTPGTRRPAVPSPANAPSRPTCSSPATREQRGRQRSRRPKRRTARGVAEQLSRSQPPGGCFATISGLLAVVLG